VPPRRSSGLHLGTPAGPGDQPPLRQSPATPLVQCGSRWPGPGLRRAPEPGLIRSNRVPRPRRLRRPRPCPGHPLRSRGVDTRCCGSTGVARVGHLHAGGILGVSNWPRWCSSSLRRALPGAARLPDDPPNGMFRLTGPAGCSTHRFGPGEAFRCTGVCGVEVSARRETTTADGRRGKRRGSYRAS